MTDFQQLIIIGTLAGRIQVHHARNGSASATFTVAVTEHWLDDEKRPMSKITHFTIRCWNRLAHHVMQHLETGDRVIVVGRVEGRAYSGRDSRPIISLEVSAKQVKILEKSHISKHNGDLMDDDSMDFSF